MSYWSFKFKFVSLGIFCLLLAWNEIYAQHKLVQVDFQIEEEGYKTFYKNALQQLQELGETRIIARLQQNFPFVKFQTDSADQKLIVTIAKQENAPLDLFLHRVDLNIQIVLGPGLATDKIATEFRSEDRFLDPLPDSNEAFVQELDNVLDFWVDREEETIIQEIMSRISLAEKAHPDKNRELWILPFSEQNFLIAEESEFKVKTVVEKQGLILKLTHNAVASGMVDPENQDFPPEYRGKILTIIKQGSPSSLSDMDHPNLKIEGIYLTKYIRSLLANPFSPDDFDFAIN